MTPASSITTSAPASVSTFAAMPPPAPEPTTQTSKTFRLRMICTVGHSMDGCAPSQDEPGERRSDDSVTILARRVDVVEPGGESKMLVTLVMPETTY